MASNNNEIEFASVEQAFQYIKTYYSEGSAEVLATLRERILATVDGAELRRLGREVPSLDRDAWDRESPGIMHDLVLESFRANPEAAQELLATGDSVITHEQDHSRWKDEFPKILMQVRDELRNPKNRQEEGVSYYSGMIEPGGDVVYVFGSNPEGRHGAGAARVAASKFGAVKGIGEGLQGSSYALPTKDLRVTRSHGYRSISEADIMKNIRRMYECAEQNPDRRFMVAYTNAPDEKTLNGYTGKEMITMFVEADGGRIPSNVVFSDVWKDEMERQLVSYDVAMNHAEEIERHGTGMIYHELKSAFSHFWDDNLKVTEDFDGFYDRVVEAFKETQGQTFGREGYLRAERFVAEMTEDLELMDYLTRSLSYSASAKKLRTCQDVREQAQVSSHDTVCLEESEGGYSQRTKENANAPEVDFTVAFAVDFNTAGERCTAKAAGDSLVKIEMTDCSDEGARKAASYLVDMIADPEGEPLGLNIAGNGIYSFKAAGMSQDDVDSFVTKVLAGAMEGGLKIASIRSGGQTGADEAGIAAAKVLEIPAVVRAPKGYVFRDERKSDHYGKEAFEARFDNKDFKGLKEEVERFLSEKRKEGEKMTYQRKVSNKNYEPRFR